MPSIAAGSVTVFYLFDIADQIDVGALRTAIGGSAEAARFLPKSAAPPYVRYSVPPVVVDGEGVGLDEIDGFKPRLKFFDYGVISLALTQPFSGEWSELLALAQTYIENDRLERRAQDACREVADRFPRALLGRRHSVLSEDYFVFSATEFDRAVTAEDLVLRHAADIAQLLRGERQPLSLQEQENVLSHRLSYLAHDVVIPTWNAAFVYDTEAGCQAALEIFELANSQLLEFRYYDDLLDVQLARIYADLQRHQSVDALVGRKYIRAANQLHALFIDVNEITDKTENALKVVGDIYAARLFDLTAARLGLSRWKASVQEKLETLDDIYRFAVEQVGISRGHLLELTIILILVVELVLFFLGIMR